MALQDLIDLSKQVEKKHSSEITEDRIKAIIPIARQYISFWREYPDLFIDFLLKMGNPQSFESILKSGYAPPVCVCSLPSCLF